MAIFLITFVVMLMVVAAMAVGVMARRKPIQGSCGGLNNLDGVDCACKTTCEATGDPIGQESGKTTLAYRA